MKRLAALGATLLVLATLSSALSPAAVVQQGTLRITLLSQVKPYKLPRTGTAPIAVFVSGHVGAVSGGVPEQLQGLRIKVNRHALLRSAGLPRCGLAKIQPATTAQSLAACGDALVGSGRFWAHIVLPEQGAYPTTGRLLVFNGSRGGRPLIYAQIYSSKPFSTSFVIPFSMRRISEGPFGTELRASLPQALGEWGYVDRIKLTLRRKYISHGRRLSYFNAGCPALPHAERASFHLAYASFDFSEGRTIGVEVTKACGVKE